VEGWSAAAAAVRRQQHSQLHCSNTQRYHHRSLISMADVPCTTPIRILVLHGYYDSAEKRAVQMRSLVKNMSKSVHFVFINSPYKYEELGFLEHIARITQDKQETEDKSDENNNGSSSNKADQRYQWLSYNPNFLTSNYEYDTLQESINYIINYINSNGPFLGILGFSQGGIVSASMLLIHSLAKYKEQNPSAQISLPFPNCAVLPDSIKFIICVGTPMIGDSRLRRYLPFIKQYNVQCLPNLHMAGASDPLVSHERSAELAQHFTNSTFDLHLGGHFVPSNSAARNTLKQFISSAVTGSV
jgi:predicted esterase